MSINTTYPDLNEYSPNYSVSCDKQEAILHGDLSNAMVDQHFVYGLQVVGVHICGVPEGGPAVIHMQARYVQTAWESFLQLSKTDQERTKAQALVLAVHASIMRGMSGPLYPKLSMCFEGA